ncbi:hypothetical protein D5085_02440 [Ectothiorhodospiraceae bacterium BW-2]|nr:hypothetical protein D5085_02440 [Ectothiorhodospiraceae bacterium BW-2]
MWKLIKQLVKVESPWLTLVGETYQKQDQSEIDYWRTESADSVIAVTLHNGCFVLPKKQYRPGVACLTLDFPGGRYEKNQDAVAVIRQVVQRELGLNELIGLSKLTMQAFL